jgi:Rap guanine nucleotide exchange factor 2
MMKSDLVLSSSSHHHHHHSNNTTTSSSASTTSSRSTPSIYSTSRFKKTLQKMSLLPRKMIQSEFVEKARGDALEDSHQPKIDFPENVLKIYKADQSFKFFLVNRETSAREVVMLAVKEFQEQGSSRDFALFQVGYIVATAGWTVGAQVTLRSWALKRP